MDVDLFIPDLRKICLDAGDAIMDVYQRDDFDIQAKGDDSPVTAADLAAHRIIEQGLSQLNPTIPQLSEEADDISFSVRQHWDLFWCIDPLDGTKEFIRRNDEFTVNIALIQSGQPILGIIHLPTSKETWWGGPRIGAWKQEANGNVRAIQSRSLGDTLIVTASRRHGQEQNDRLLVKLASRFNNVESLASGSSLKMCLIAEGKADLYPRLFPTSEWDTAAAQAIVEAAGGKLVHAENLQPLKYNQQESLINPFFYVVGDPDFPLHALASTRDSSTN